MQLNHIRPLLDKLARREQSPAEMEVIRHFLQHASRQDAEAAMEHYYTALDGMNVTSDTKALAYRLEQLINKPITPVHRIHFLKTAWFKYAAAILLVLTGAITYYFFSTSQSQVEVAQTTPSPLPKEDILPGSDRAVLTLSNGQQVQLNNATSETITDGTLSIKNINGQLSYTSAGLPIPSTGGVAPRGAGVGHNTMSTPRGGQYKLTLSDGTKVWLNAASSITYPIAFTSKTREVSITGEAYFEVSKNKENPFIVKTIKEEITVLGTAFNVNSYPDENSKTSLIEGSVRISPASAANASASGLSPAGGGGFAGGETGGGLPAGQTAIGTILKPGQAYQNGKVTTTNTSQDIAWKNGHFNFNGADLKTVMRQLQRWYDIDVKYTGKIKEGKFRGELHRDLSLLQITNILKEMDVKFRLEGRTLFVE